MKVKWVSVAMPELRCIEGKEVLTGIYKKPVDGPVELGLENFAGDGQADLSVHGGRDKAAYVYSHDYYPLWANDLGVPQIAAAQFGENLTVEGCRDEDVVIGARYRIGQAEVMVTQPRIPCFKLAARLNDKSFARTFWETGRLGFYVRVEKTGLVGPGDNIQALHAPAHEITVRRYWETVVNADVESAKILLHELEHLDAGAARRLKNLAAKN